MIRRIAIASVVLGAVAIAVGLCFWLGWPAGLVGLGVLLVLAGSESL